MSYRKINVAGKSYEYVVGQTHVKIKGLGAWPKEEVGEYDTDHGEPTFVQVRPGHVAQKILSLTAVNKEEYAA